MPQLNETAVWKEIIAQGEALKTHHLRSFFEKDAGRFAALSIKTGEIFLDYSRQRIVPEVLPLFQRLLEQQGFTAARAQLFSGAKVNASENRAALHMKLRAKDDAEVTAELTRALSFADAVRAGQITGATGKPIKNIVHIGIGGSDLGPQLLTRALGDAKAPRLFFIRNVDAAPIVQMMRQLNAEETLLLVASKTFTTVETMLNAQTLLDWLATAMPRDKAFQHIIALTAAPEKAADFGVLPQNVFRFWDWVGGRFSIWSVIGLPAMMAMGSDAYTAFLSGGAAMDRHFLDAPLLQNMPVILALLSIWNINVLGHKARAVLPYAEALSEWPSYLQQLEMESLGKSVDRTGQKLGYATAPVVFGMPGTPAQHAFMQALHQGTEIIPAEIILVARDKENLPAHSAMLLANGLAQAEALARGKTADEVLQDKHIPEALLNQKVFPGNRPSSVLVLDALSPFTLGQLVALYEHKVFTESVLWNINPFDQWGVELGKTLAGPIEVALGNDGAAKKVENLAMGLVDYLKNLSSKA